MYLWWSLIILIIFHDRWESLTILNPELGFLVPQRQHHDAKYNGFWFGERGHGISTYMLLIPKKTRGTHPISRPRRRIHAIVEEGLMQVQAIEPWIFCRSWSDVRFPNKRRWTFELKWLVPRNFWTHNHFLEEPHWRLHFEMLSCRQGENISSQNIHPENRWKYLFFFNHRMLVGISFKSTWFYIEFHRISLHKIAIAHLLFLVVGALLWLCSFQTVLRSLGPIGCDQCKYPMQNPWRAILRSRSAQSSPHWTYPK